MLPKSLFPWYQGRACLSPVRIQIKLWTAVSALPRNRVTARAVINIRQTTDGVTDRSWWALVNIVSTDQVSVTLYHWITTSRATIDLGIMSRWLSLYMRLMQSNDRKRLDRNSQAKNCAVHDTLRRDCWPCYCNVKLGGTALTGHPLSAPNERFQKV
jgi:hypothetical protein